jgi:hypothetical protein
VWAQAADRALAEASKGHPKVRPINPKEAARGKVDYVQVRMGTHPITRYKLTAATFCGLQAAEQDQCGEHDSMYCVRPYCDVVVVHSG